MKYLIFDTEQEAIAKENEISLGFGYAKPGINAATGAIMPDVLTVRWDIPRQISDGRWIITSPSDEGIEEESGWFSSSEVAYEKD